MSLSHSNAAKNDPARFMNLWFGGGTLAHSDNFGRMSCSSGLTGAICGEPVQHAANKTYSDHFPSFPEPKFRILRRRPDGDIVTTSRVQV